MTAGDTILFSVPGKPVAKGRAIATTLNGHVRMRTPERTVAYESTVRLFASQAMAGRSMMDGALHMTVIAKFPIAPSWPKKRAQAARDGQLRPTGRPDADNVAKAISDACNGICYPDDSCIVSLLVEKQYADVPGVDVSIRRLLMDWTV